jgi:aryl-alcohol dehydrogenase-like predicted oxidoreductase
MPLVCPTGLAHLLIQNAGFRHIDTAQAYGDERQEEQVGKLLQKTSIPLDDLYLTSKCESLAGSARSLTGSNRVEDERLQGHHTSCRSQVSCAKLYQIAPQEARPLLNPVSPYRWLKPH